MLSFQSTVWKPNDLLIPKDSFVIVAHDKWDSQGHVFKLNDIKEENGKDMTIMKIATVQFLVVQDGLDEDLNTELFLEQTQSLQDFKDEEYLQHTAKKTTSHTCIPTSLTYRSK